MNIKIVVLFLLFVISSINIFSQIEIYMDENLKTIDSTIYKRKCSAQIFKCYAYKTDSLKINKVLYKYNFGKITSTEANQLRLLLSSRNKSKINPNATIILTYRDTLYSFAHRFGVYEMHFNKMEEKIAEKRRSADSIGSHRVKFKNGHKEYTRKKFSTLIRKEIQKREKCIKKTERRFNSRVFYTYNYDKGFLKDYPKHWTKDNGIIKNKFFNIIYNSHLLILKPSGEYFLGGSHLSDVDFKKLVRNDNWDIFKRDLENSMLSLNKNGLGIFKKPYGMHQKHCF